jgi:hypothetical protein
VEEVFSRQLQFTINIKTCHGNVENPHKYLGKEGMKGGEAGLFKHISQNFKKQNTHVVP